MRTQIIVPASPHAHNKTRRTPLKGQDDSPTRLSRRRVLKTMAGAGAAAALGSHPLHAVAARKPDIQHIVLLMMENRSFDHFLGWVPGANGEQEGLAYPDSSDQLQSTAPLAPDYQDCSHPDPDHSYDGARVEYDGGACDGWLRAGANDSYSIGYYTAADLPFFAGAVPS